MRATFFALLAAAVAGLGVSAARADVTLMSDSLTGSGALAGSSPTTGSGTWTAYYYNNQNELVPTNQTDATGAGFSAAATTGALPVDPVRSGSGINVSATTQHTDDGAFIGITPASAGVITAAGTFTFPSTAANASNPTAWAFIGFTTGFTTTPDVVANATSTAEIGPWLLVRPASNGTDVVELYANGGTTKQVTTTNNEVGNGSHTMEILFDPAAGTLNAEVDGTLLLTTPYSYSANSVAVPAINGFILGNRTNTNVASAANPSTTFLSNVSVTQVPEPASLGLLALGAMGLFARRRR